MRVSEELINEELDILERVSGLQMNPLAMSVMSNIWRVSQAFKQDLERDILRGYGLTFSSFSTLFIVWIWGPIEMSALAESQTVARSTVTSTVNLLEKRGLLLRQGAGDGGDKRSVLVQVTENGRELIEQVYPDFNAGEQVFIAGLTVDESEMLAVLLRKLWRSRRVE